MSKFRKVPREITEKAEVVKLREGERTIHLQVVPRDRRRWSREQAWVDVLLVGHGLTVTSVPLVRRGRSWIVRRTQALGEVGTLFNSIFFDQLAVVVNRLFPVEEAE
jgi:hypothetical protein